MGKNGQLPSGVVIVNDQYRFDFRWKGTRYRLRTTYTTKDKSSEVVKLFNSLLFDLEKGKFNAVFYVDKIPNVNILNGIKNLNNMTDLLLLQVENYRNRHDLTFASFVNLESVINLHLLPHF